MVAHLISVSVSVSFAVETDVTVTKTVVVTPSTLVLVLVPPPPAELPTKLLPLWSWSSSSPPSSPPPKIPGPKPKPKPVSVGAGASSGDAEDVICTGMTTRGAAADDEVDEKEGSVSGVGVGKGSRSVVVCTVIIDVLVVREVEVLVGSDSSDVSSVADEVVVSEDKVDRTVVVIWMVEDPVSSELSAVAVTVREGTVTVVKPPTPADSTVDVALSVELVLDSVAVSVTLVAEPSCVEPKPEPEPELVLPSGTEPRTASTVSLGKQRRLTPLVEFSGIAAQTVPSLHPTISQEPPAEQWAYSASTQAYCPGLHAEAAEISVKAALSLIASARFEAYCEEETTVVPVGTAEVITAVGIKSLGVPVGVTLLVAEEVEEFVMAACCEVSEAVSAVIVSELEVKLGLAAEEAVIGRPFVGDCSFWDARCVGDCRVDWSEGGESTSGEGAAAAGVAKVEVDTTD